MVVMELFFENKTGQKLFLQLIEDGLNGDVKSFEMRARRLASKIKMNSPELSKKIGELVANQGCLRMADNRDILPAPVEPDTRQNLLIRTFPVTLNREPVWDKVTANAIKRFLRERERAEELLNEGLMPCRSLIMSGPPGAGKTLAASWLAREMKLPLLTLDLATVMSSYLGKTGNNIRAVLNYASSFPCVLLLDEFDAIAKKRDDDTDVGELKRLVTVLLQAIDDWPISSVLVAATNHGDLLDPAIWRRFDSIVEFDYPDDELITEFCVQWGLDPIIASWVAMHVEKASLAILEKKLNQAKKDNILEDKSIVKALMDVFQISEPPNNDEYRSEIVWDLHSENITKVRIAEITGLHRHKVTSLIKEKERQIEQSKQGELAYD